MIASSSAGCRAFGRAAAASGSLRRAIAFAAILTLARPAILHAGSPPETEPAPGASTTDARPDHATPDPVPGEPVDPGAGIEAPPSDADLATAPPPHEAAGRLRDHERKEGVLRAVVNAVLWTPRRLLELGLWVPDMVAGRVDDHLDSRGPNVYNRGSESSGWGGGAMFAWEAPFGPSAGAQVSYSFGSRLTTDLTAVLFGRYGYTGRVGLTFEPRAGGPVGIELEAEYGHAREIAFAGIGDHELGDAPPGADLDPYAPGAVPETILDDRALSVRLGVPVELGELLLRPSGHFERHEVRPDEEASFAYDRAALVGFEEPFFLGHARLDATYDNRAAPYPWIPRGAPATGWRARAAVGYTVGSSENDGDFRFGRYLARLERLFDVYGGTHVIGLRARVEGITTDSTEIPFVLLPSLGGPDDLRAFSRGRFRDETATSAELSYEWAVGLHARASLFVEVGGVHDGPGAVDTDPLHLSAGAAYRMVYDDVTALRGVIAGSDTGELSFFLVLGGV